MSHYEIIGLWWQSELGYIEHLALSKEYTFTRYVHINLIHFNVFFLFQYNIVWHIFQRGAQSVQMWALIIQNYIIPFSKWILKMLSIRMLWNISERKSEVQKELSWWTNSYQLKVFIGLQADIISLFKTDSQQTEECSVAQQRYLRWQDIFLCYQFICAYVQAWSMICIVFVSVSLLIKCVLPENLEITRICIHYRETCSLLTCYGYVLPEGSQRK